ncbi:hypothetical protein DL93DRAFT_2091052 [Clavulina sp. PMI_390]|nr:hypothetical protein DL93DRAFT_2091052 [Clavulina sp. PMI_390]
MAALTISPPHVMNSSTHERFNFPDGLAVLPSDYSSVLNKVDSLSPKAQTQSGPDPSVNAPQMHQDGGGSSGSSAVDGRVEEPIQQDIDTYGIAGRIWEAAFDLQAYFHSPPHLEFDPPCPLSSRLRSYPAGSTQRVLVELGSGTGVAGLSAASVLASSSSPSISEDVRSSYTANKQTSLSAAHAESADRCRDVIFLTDLPEVVPLLETNVLRWKNELGRAANVESSASASSPSQPTAEDSRVDVRVRALPWGDRHAAERVFEEARRSQSRDGVEREGGITHVLCSDLVYFPGLLAPLLRTLLHLTEKDACRCPPLHDNPGSDPEQLNGPENVGVTVIISCKPQFTFAPFS